MKDKIDLNRRAMRVLAILCLVTLGLHQPLHAQYVHTNGTQIVDENGNDLYFTGMNLGNWLLWEGYLMMGDFNYRTHTQFFNSVKDAFGGDLGQAIEFEHQWRMNYVTAQGIADLKGLGFNSVRVPFHFNLFWDYNSNAPSDRGFQYIDRVVNFCRAQGMYVLLDMHAAPGYQNPGDHSDNVNSNASQPRESVTFWDGNNVNIAAEVWKHIASYYANEPVIWGYDLINEPVPQPGREFELLGSMITMRNAIREVDNNHIIVAEGSWWGSDMQKLDWMDPETQNQSGINYRWDNNLVYQTHHYSNDVSALDGRLDLCNKLNVPLILGEYGESDNSNLRNMTDWCLNNNVDYFPWSFKKMSHDRTLWTIHPNAPYENLKNFINNGGTPPANIYNDMIAFCQNNIANGSPGLTWHQGFYDAVKNTGLTQPQGCDNASAVGINGAIEAESYCDMNGLQTETSSEGGENLGYADPGDWADYRVDVPSSGTYTVNFRVASGDTGSKSIELQGSGNVASASFDATGGWQTWTTASASLYLNAGIQTLRLYFPNSGINVNWFELSTSPVLSSIQISPASVTLNVGQSQSFSATGYDQNGNVMNISPSWSGADGNGLFTATAAGTFTVTASQNGVSASATVTVNPNNNAINLPGVIEAENYSAMSGIQTEACSEGGENIGYVDAGDWADYSVNVNSSGSYQVSFRVAADGNANKSIQLQASSGTASASFNATGGWQNWSTVTATISLNAGTQTLRLYFPSSGLNVNYVSLAAANNPTPSTQRIEAENYFEMSGLDTENAQDAGGGQNVGWIDAGDWAGYSVNIPSTGSYTVSYRVASPSGGGQIVLEPFGGGSAYGTINVDATGGWQSWTTISQNVQLNAGVQDIALAFASGGFNLNWFEISNSSGARIAGSTVVSHELQLAAYPNPANHLLNIEGVDESSKHMAIFGIDGRLKYRQQLAGEKRLVLDVSSLDRGVYLLRFDGGQSLRFVKN
ncbi:carbohydrate-binding protein [Reichenbachiella ulvae]|uniref:Carbohydrate-binding protein n=1 Tax=Reichenbachiella ulvae TaxID=2980104 RepID=A0ABT3CVS2_9BACT|nr:carbohydrate-binding protein [Reichenbachiella ulvae]MCV9387649.1 carbohydrate-binding protein [Reichenbachiella ulvae]